MKRNPQKGPKKVKIPIEYMGMSLDSMEEKMFLYWCEELIQAGYIEKVERAKSYKLTNGVYNCYTKETQLKTKLKCEPKMDCVLNTYSYEPDFHVFFTAKGFEKFCWKLGTPTKVNKEFIADLLYDFNKFCTFEIKGNFNRDNMIRLFQNNRKVLYDKYGIFANLVIPDKLFEATFLPKKASLTPTGQQRKINYPTKTLQEFLYE